MGKSKYIESPDKMWEYFLAYKDEVKSKPIYVAEQKRGNTILPKDLNNVSNEIISKSLNSIVELPMQRPLTLEGFENWCFENGIINDLGHYFANTDNRYSDYCTICSRIKKMIRQDQIEGGMVGIYNPSITQRLNGLSDSVKQDIKVENKTPVFSENPLDRE